MGSIPLKEEAQTLASAPPVPNLIHWCLEFHVLSGWVSLRSLWPVHTVKERHSNTAEGTLHQAELHWKSWAPNCKIMRPGIGFSYWDELCPSSQGEDRVRPPSEWESRDDLAKSGLGQTGKAQNNKATCWVPDPSQAELFGISAPMWAVGSYIICYNGLISFFPPSFWVPFAQYLYKKKRIVSGLESGACLGEWERMDDLRLGEVHNLHRVPSASVFQTILCDPLVDHESNRMGHDLHFLYHTEEKILEQSHVISSICFAKLLF